MSDDNLSDCSTIEHVERVSRNYNAVSLGCLSKAKHPMAPNPNFFNNIQLCLTFIAGNYPLYLSPDSVLIPVSKPATNKVPSG